LKIQNNSQELNIARLVTLLRKQLFGVKTADGKSHGSKANAVASEDVTAASTEMQTLPDGAPRTVKPKSLYPAAMLGFAMVSRGEIGFLISSVAESAGIWRDNTSRGGSSSDNRSSDMFIVVTWAMVICTFLGPVAVGLIVRRVKRLEKAKGGGAAAAAGRSVLGSWGVEI